MIITGQLLSSTSVVVLETMVLASNGLEAKSAGLGLGLELSGLGVGLGLLTTGLGLGLAFKQDQDLINFYCAISAKKLHDYYSSLRSFI